MPESIPEPTLQDKTNHQAPEPNPEECNLEPIFTAEDPDFNGTNSDINIAQILGYANRRIADINEQPNPKEFFNRKYRRKDGFAYSIFIYHNENQTYFITYIPGRIGEGTSAIIRRALIAPMKKNGEEWILDNTPQIMTRKVMRPNKTEWDFEREAEVTKFFQKDKDACVLYYVDKEIEQKNILIPYIPGKNLLIWMKTPRFEYEKIQVTYRILALWQNIFYYRGCLHRDLKPENIMVYSESDHLKIAFIDFATTAPASLVTTIVSGTKEYIPETVLAGNEKQNYATEIWAIGLIGKELFNWIYDSDKTITHKPTGQFLHLLYEGYHTFHEIKENQPPATQLETLLEKFFDLTEKLMNYQKNSTDHEIERFLNNIKEELFLLAESVSVVSFGTQDASEDTFQSGLPKKIDDKAYTPIAS